MDLSSRVVLITGGRRMGGAIASAVSTRGADVVITFRGDAADAHQVTQAVGAAGRRGLAVQADVADPAGVAALMRMVDDTFGRLDVLVNMASVYRAVPYDDLDFAEWNRQLGVDLGGTFLCTKAAVPLMRKTGGGRVINFSDWLPSSGRPRYKSYVPYYVAKAGVRALTEALALELAADRILVNAIAPGPILAPAETTDAEHAAVERATPLGQWGGPGEIAKAVLALIDTDFITGETIRVDGGRHLL